MRPSPPTWAPPPADILAVLARIQGAGHEAWLVGGAVRDRVLGRAGGDWDVASSAEPAEIMALFDKVVPTGLQHGTVTVVQAGEPIEVTTFRVDGAYTDGRRPDSVHFTRSLEEDLARRDFTINAMAWDPLHDVVADPFGGRADIERRLIRAVGDPVARFTEDGLRAMRAVRFGAVLGFSIDPATHHAIQRTVGTFRQISAERVRVELVKTFASPRAAQALGVLRESGLLEACLPEVASLADADFARLVRAFAALPHLPIAQGDTRSFLSFGLLLYACTADPEPVLRRLRCANDERRTVGALLRLRDVGPHPASDRDVRALVAQVTPSLLDTWLVLRGVWEGEGPWAALAARIETLGARHGPQTSGDLALDGRRVMEITGLPPSRRVGRVLRWLLEQVWLNPAHNTAHTLEAMLPRALEAVSE